MGRKISQINRSFVIKKYKKKTIEIEHKNAILTVSTELIQPLNNKESDPRPFVYKKGQLWQFIGEMKELPLNSTSSATSSSSSTSSSATTSTTTPAKSTNLVLIARVASNVEGMNMTLYERALMVQRDFLKQLKKRAMEEKEVEVVEVVESASKRLKTSQ